MSVHADAQESVTVVPAGVFKLRQRGRLSHAIVRLFALIVLVLGSVIEVLWTEPYPSLFIWLAFQAVALYGTRRPAWSRNCVDTSRVLTGVLRAKRTLGVCSETPGGGVSMMHRNAAWLTLGTIGAVTAYLRLFRRGSWLGSDRPGGGAFNAGRCGCSAAHVQCHARRDCRGHA